MLVLTSLLSISCAHALQLSSSASEVGSADKDPVPRGDDWDWEKQPNPSWLFPEMTGAPPKGAKIAIAFRGEYLRQTPAPKLGCSDYWMNKANIDEFVVAPLRKAGAQVKLYFHTYTYCPETDKDLVAEMKPAKFEIGGPISQSNPRWGQTGSMFEAMRVVVEDDWADYFVMIRFDTSFHAKITSLNVNWDLLNIGWRGAKKYFDNLHKVGDLFFAMPTKYVDYFAAALKDSAGQPPELGLPPSESDVAENFWKSDDLLNNTLSGEVDVETDEEVPHLVYDPLVKLIGQKNIHFMDEDGHLTGSNTGFTYINRQCSSHALTKC